MSYLTNPYMVAAGETCFESYSYANSNPNAVLASYCSTRDMMGITVVAGSSLIGGKVTSVDFDISLSGTGGSCGTVSSRIVADASAGSSTETAVETSSDTYAVTSLSSGIYSFTFAGTTTLAEDSGIELHATDTNTCMDCWTNYITLRTRTSTSTDDGVFRGNEWNGSAFEAKDTDSNITIKVCYE